MAPAAISEGAGDQLQSHAEFFQTSKMLKTVCSAEFCFALSAGLLRLACVLKAFPGVFVVPLFSWYNPEFDTEDPLLDCKDCYCDCLCAEEKSS